MNKRLHKLINKTLLGAFYVFLLLAFASDVSAYSIDILPNPTDTNQFVVGPGKTQLFLDPGQSETITVLVSNLTGDERTFIIETEDFGASANPNEAIKLLGSDRGPYSLKDYISFSQKTFTLKHGERAHIPVTVQAPYDAEPGGLYGAAIVSMYPLPTPTGGGRVQSQTPIVKRIGSLFYVRVSGPVVEDVSLVDFSTVGHKKWFNKKWFNNAPVDFNILIENKGSVHAIPSAMFSLTNMFGETIETSDLGSWFVMPNSTRLRQFRTNRDFLLGRYVAQLELDLTTDNTEIRSVVFWVIPWKLILLILLIILIVWRFINWVTKNFQIKRKV